MSKKNKILRTKFKKELQPIEFSKVQQGYLNEILARQRDEFNKAVESVYEELGILEKMLKAPFGTYRLRKDCSGLDVLPNESKPPK
jgi:hypothetical protein